MVVVVVVIFSGGLVVIVVVVVVTHVCLCERLHCWHATAAVEDPQREPDSAWLRKSGAEDVGAQAGATVAQGVSWRMSLYKDIGGLRKFI